MTLEISVEQEGDVRILRVLGPCAFREFVTGLREPIAAARDDRVARVVIVAAGLIGDAPPAVGERHWLVREWAAVADNRTRFALVVPEPTIDPERFGVVAAANFGIRSAVFADEAEALAWVRRDD